MGECDEVAAAMVDGHDAWLEHTVRLATLVAARAFVDRQIPDEGMTVRDNVTTSLLERTIRAWRTTTRLAIPRFQEAAYARPKPTHGLNSACCVPEKGRGSIATSKELAIASLRTRHRRGTPPPSLLLGTRLVKPFIGQAKSPFGGHKPSVLDSVKNASLEFV